MTRGCFAPAPASLCPLSTVDCSPWRSRPLGSVVGACVWCVCVRACCPGVEAALTTMSRIPFDDPMTLGSSLQRRAALLAKHKENIAHQKVLCGFSRLRVQCFTLLLFLVTRTVFERVRVWDGRCALEALEYISYFGSVRLPEHDTAAGWACCVGAAQSCHTHTHTHPAPLLTFARPTPTQLHQCYVSPPLPWDVVVVLLRHPNTQVTVAVFVYPHRDSVAV